MATPSTVTALADISQYLWTYDIARSNSFYNGTNNMNQGRDIVLLVENAALEWGIENDLDGVQGVANDVYRLCGAKLQQANEVLETGSSGGIIVNPSTGVASLVPYEDSFVIGDVGAPILNGETSYTINIGTARIWNSASMIITLDQAVLPKDQSGYVSYSATYDTITGLVTITFTQAVATGQLYTVQFYYLVV